MKFLDRRGDLTAGLTVARGDGFGMLKRAGDLVASVVVVVVGDTTELVDDPEDSADVEDAVDDCGGRLVKRSVTLDWADSIASPTK